MQLYITSRASVARAIARGLTSLQGRGEQPARHNDHFEVGADIRVTWTGGHLLELAPPEDYDPRFSAWRLEDLPIIPSDHVSENVGHSTKAWRLREPLAQTEGKHRARPAQARQFSFIRDALKHADEVVHAGDPDREGQWLIDEVLDYLGYQGVVWRLHLHSLNRQTLRRELQEFCNKVKEGDKHTELSNKNFRSLSISARTRSYADWLFGMNMTRAYTILGRHGGYGQVLSIGRVQTALLALVVQRDIEIESFQAEHTCELHAKFKKDGSYCYAQYVINQQAVPVSAALNQTDKPAMTFQVLNDGVIEKKDLQEIEHALLNQTGSVTACDVQHHVSVPPLPLNLSELQITCARQLGYSPLDVAQIAQRLYDEYHMITYPRSNCRYLPTRKREQIESVLDAVVANLPKKEQAFRDQIPKADGWRETACWDNKKVTDHHAIIPTDHVLEKAEKESLTEEEINVYEVICSYYAAQFFPDCETQERELDFSIQPYQFRYRLKEVVHPGWQAILSALPGADDFKNRETYSAVRSEDAFPPWQPGDEVLCEDVQIREHRTTPPPRFTDASLMEALANIAPHVHHDQTRDLLQDHDGLGTESTRAQMIDTLFKRGYLTKGNRNIFSSSVARDLIKALPAEATQVDMTALWERQLSHIADLPAEEAEQAAAQFLQEVEQRLRDFITQAQQLRSIHITSVDEVLGLKEKLHVCPQCEGLLKKRKGKYGEFWGCSNYPQCKYTTKNPDKSEKEN